jgi:Fic family protein
VARSAQNELSSLLEVVRQHPEGVRRSELEKLLGTIPQRTLQYRLRLLVAGGQLSQTGKGPAARYHVETPEQPAPAKARADNPTSQFESNQEVPIPLSPGGEDVRAYVKQPQASRKPVGYSRKFLDEYRPNVNYYLTEEDRTRLARIGRTQVEVEAAGTYAKQILNRLLIDLSWNSSRLEGNTYSLLDTRRLIEFGEETQGSSHLDAQMILNHKDAIAFLVTAAEDIGFNRYTILNLHGILANNLLPDQSAAGRLRRMAVGIAQSSFHPLEVPQLIEECFDQVLATAAAIQNPFEQAFFAMVHLPYLQPFDDVNKRVSRLAANIPFIRKNLSPLSFTDVPRSTYTEAMLGVYELNRIDLLKDVFLWSYERSAERYAAVRQSLGEPDPFRQRHHNALRQVIGDVLRSALDRRATSAHIAKWTSAHVSEPDQEQFRNVVESDLLSLHEGNFARYQVRPSEFAAWQAAWHARELTFPMPAERYDFTRDTVFFTGQDGPKIVRCAVSEEALADHFVDGGDPLQVFRAHRPAIEAIARRKYLSGQVDPDGRILIRTADLPSRTR